MNLETGDIKIEFTSSSDVKFTFTKDGDIRLKFPFDTSQEETQRYIRIAEYSRQYIGSIENTLRGRIRDGYLVLMNNSRTKIKSIPIDPKLYE